MKPITKTLIQKQPLIYTLDNVFDDHYCQELIAESEGQIYEKAMITIGENQ